MTDRPPPAVDRGAHRPLSQRAQRLVDRAGLTDRSTAARERVARVVEEEARAASRSRLVRVIGWGTVTIAFVAAGGLLRGPIGVAAGAGVVILLALLRRGVDRAAARRGATAWDWRARRYRLTGNPSAEVQSLDGYTGARDALGQRKRPAR